jgi:hypothetical protein
MAREALTMRWNGCSVCTLGFVTLAAFGALACSGRTVSDPQQQGAAQWNQARLDAWTAQPKAPDGSSFEGFLGKCQAQSDLLTEAKAMCDGDVRGELLLNQDQCAGGPEPVAAGLAFVCAHGPLTCPAVGSKVCPGDPPTTYEAAMLCGACLSQLQAFATCAGLTNAPHCDANGMSTVVMPPVQCNAQVNALANCAVNQANVGDAGVGFGVPDGG